jgi:hypothetical protein
MGRKRWLGVALACATVLVGLAGCDGDDDEASGTTTTPPTTTSTTTTTAPTTTTTPIAGPAPWTDVVRDLFARDWALQTDPDPNAVAALYSTNCECYSFFLSDIQTLASNGQHLEGESPAPVAVVAEAPTAPFQRLIVKVAYGPQRVVDSTGAVIGETPGQDPHCVSILIAPTGASGAYQVHDYFLPEGCPEGL